MAFTHHLNLTYGLPAAVLEKCGFTVVCPRPGLARCPAGGLQQAEAPPTMGLSMNRCCGSQCDLRGANRVWLSGCELCVSHTALVRFRGGLGSSKLLCGIQCERGGKSRPSFLARFACSTSSCERARPALGVVAGWCPPVRSEELVPGAPGSLETGCTPARPRQGCRAPGSACRGRPAMGDRG